MIGARVGIYSGKGFGYDIDAKNFLEAAGIPNDSTVYNASTAAEKIGAELWTLINNTVIALKTAGFYSSAWNMTGYSSSYLLRGLWPVIDTSSSGLPKWNLCDPQDTDAAYRLTFHGGLTFNDLYIQGDGSSGRIQTKYGWGGGGDGDIFDYSIGTLCLSSSAGASDYLLYGMQNSTFRISWDNFSTNRSFVVNGANTGGSITINPNSKMLDVSQCVRTANNLGYILNGDTVNPQSSTIASATPSTFSEMPFLVTYNAGTSTYQLYSNQKIATMYIGKGFSSTVALTLRTIIRDYETSRGRL